MAKQSMNVQPCVPAHCVLSATFVFCASTEFQPKPSYLLIAENRNWVHAICQRSIDRTIGKHYIRTPNRAAKGHKKKVCPNPVMKHPDPTHQGFAGPPYFPRKKIVFVTASEQF